MKTKHIAKIVALAAVLTTCAYSQTTWFYGASDNSANFGISADTSQSIGWQDNWAGGTNFDTNRFGTVSLQSNRPNLLGQQQSIMMYGFAGTGLSAANVNSALLYLRQDFSSTAQSWDIVGIASGNAAWDTANMDWNDLDDTTATDWTGGTLLGSLSGSFGSFNTTGLGTDTNINVDITSAFQAYLNGTISGIAFVNSTNGTTLNAGDNRFIPFSNENLTASNRPGLLVTAVPEPAAAGLGALGLLFLLRRRR